MLVEDGKTGLIKYIHMISFADSQSVVRQSVSCMLKEDVEVELIKGLHVIPVGLSDNQSVDQPGSCQSWQ